MAAHSKATRGRRTAQPVANESFAHDQPDETIASNNRKKTTANKKTEPTEVATESQVYPKSLTKPKRGRKPKQAKSNNRDASLDEPETEEHLTLEPFVTTRANTRSRTKSSSSNRQRNIPSVNQPSTFPSSAASSPSSTSTPRKRRQNTEPEAESTPPEKKNKQPERSDPNLAKNSLDFIAIKAKEVSEPDEEERLGDTPQNRKGSRKSKGKEKSTEQHPSTPTESVSQKTVRRSSRRTSKVTDMETPDLKGKNSQTELELDDISHRSATVSHSTRVLRKDTTLSSQSATSKPAQSSEAGEMNKDKGKKIAQKTKKTSAGTDRTNRETHGGTRRSARIRKRTSGASASGDDDTAGHVAGEFPMEAAGHHDDSYSEDKQNDDDDMEDEDEKEGHDDDADMLHARNRDSTTALFADLFMGGEGSGVSLRLRTILQNLKGSRDPSVQLIALQDLAEILLVANEDSLAGIFPIDTFVREIISVLKGNSVAGSSSMNHDEYGGEYGDFDAGDNPETMLLACRCLSNLVEAMPSAAPAIVYGGAVPVLCAKLLEIQYIDLAEGALGTLEKLSYEYPAAIVREGGLSAVLQFLDFFSTNVQRTAVTTAANCAKSIPAESFPQVRDVFPVLERVLGYTDTRVVEQTCLCLVRLTENFKNNTEKLEALVSDDLLRTAVKLLGSGEINATGSSATSPPIFSNILQFLSIVAKASPQRGFALLQMGMVDTLYTILTGARPPVDKSSAGTDADTGESEAGFEELHAIESAMVQDQVQKRAKDQICDILGVASELLPPLPRDGVFEVHKTSQSSLANPANTSGNVTAANAVGTSVAEADTPAVSGCNFHIPSPSSSTSNAPPVADARIELLKNAPHLITDYGRILLPVLIEIFSGSLHLQIRRRVVLSILKILHYMTSQHLAAILHNVSFATFVANLLSQNSNKSSPDGGSISATPASTEPAHRGYNQNEHQHIALTIAGLQMAELCMIKLPELYHTHFRREGVMHEICRLADMTIVKPNLRANSSESVLSNTLGESVISSVAQTSADDAVPTATTTTTSSGEKGSSLSSELASTSSTTPSIAYTNRRLVEIVISRMREMSAEGLDVSSIEDELVALIGDATSGRTSSGDHPTTNVIGADTSAATAASGSSASGDDPRASAGATLLGRLQAARELLSARGFGSGRGSLFGSGSSPGNFGRQEKWEAMSFDARSWTVNKARELREKYFSEDAHAFTEKELEHAHPATRVLYKLRELSNQLGGSEEDPAAISTLREIAGYFTASPNGLSSFELLRSNLMSSLLSYLVTQDVPDDNASDFITTSTSKGKSTCVLDENDEPQMTYCAKRKERLLAFAQVFLGVPVPKNLNGARQSEKTDTSAGRNVGEPQPFGVLVRRLQESLSRMEPFEVVLAVSGPAFDSRRSQESMLARQLRIRLTADEGTEVPRGYQSLVVTVHAVASFRTLNDYLRPRLASSMMRQSSGSLVGNTIGSTKSSSSADLSTLSTSASAVGASSGRITEAATESAVAKRTDEPREGAMDVDVDAMESHEEDEGMHGEHLDSEMDLDDEEYAEDETGSEIIDDDDPLLRRDSVDSQSSMRRYNVVNLEMGVDGKVSTPLGAQAPAPENVTDTSQSAKETQASSSGTQASASQKPPVRSTTMSYAAAVTNAEKEWQLEFLVGDNVVDLDTTLYGAIYKHEMEQNHDPRNIWVSTSLVRYRRVPGPTPQAPSGFREPTPSDNEPYTDVSYTTQLPASVQAGTPPAKILNLLRVVHALNFQWADLLESDDEIPSAETVASLPSKEFVNTKLTAKVGRQMDEPLIVASQILPGWCMDLPRYFPFLFPFETRILFLQATSFGFARGIQRWQSQQSRNGAGSRRDDTASLVSRIVRQKVRIYRDKMLESAAKVFELYGTNHTILEIEYFDEVGTGLGPTLEFYANVSRELCRQSLYLWRDDAASPKPGSKDFVSAPLGLFPAPKSAAELATDSGKKLLDRFKMIGQFVAKSLLDSRIIDLHFNPTFINLILGKRISPSIRVIKQVDASLGRSLSVLQEFVAKKKMLYSDKDLSQQQLSEKMNELNSALGDMCLDFTLPGFSNIELKTEGSAIPVTIYNVEEYIHMVSDYMVGRGIEKQVEAFRRGFNLVFALKDLRTFTANELVAMFGRGEEDWSIDGLQRAIKADHGFTMDSPSINNLLEILEEFTDLERREFLQFITGSPKLPIGGFKNLTPPFTVVCKPFEAPLTADDYLPSVMTCVNYLKMPDYSTKEIMRAKLKLSMKEGQGSFHLS